MWPHSEIAGKKKLLPLSWWWFGSESLRACEARFSRSEVEAQIMRASAFSRRADNLGLKKKEEPLAAAAKRRKVKRLGRLLVVARLQGV